MTEGQYVTNDVAARLGAALIIAGGLVAAGARVSLAVIAAGAWLIISIALEIR